MDGHAGRGGTTRTGFFSLLELPLAGEDECDGTVPPLGDLLADARDAEAVPASRLPAL